MATNIPGRRVNIGDTLYTDWGPRGGDCALLRAQALIKSPSGGTGTIQISMETRSEEDVSATQMYTSYPSSGNRLLELTAVGVKTAIYTATANATASGPIRGIKEQVRLKITFPGTLGASNDYYVVRLFPLAFFDNSIPGS